MNQEELNRRDFLKGGSLATLMSMLGAVELKAQLDSAPAATNTQASPFQMKCAVIGLGRWGREILANLTRRNDTIVAAICDTYPAFLKRAARTAPNAEAVSDYAQILANKEIEALFVATPSHRHKDIVLEALKAQKHVYCEAPLAVTIEDARTIARAAHAAVRSNFQPGLQMRSDPQRQFLLPFIRSGATGRQVKARAQWHKKDSWRTVFPTPERERELNWRLSHATSPGLPGELGIHQIDAMSWFINNRPVAVTGLGSIVQWNDGREVDDTVEVTFEYPNGVTAAQETTLASSFDGDYEMYYGSMATVMVRGTKAWMFKEADSPMLGWEVYARKDTFYKETGIALIANATKQSTVVQKDLDEEAYEDSPLYRALGSFIYNSHLVGTGVKDFIDTFGEDDNALRDYLGEMEKDRLPAASYLDGFQATMMALVANEAAKKRQRIVFEKDWFEI